jgi:hypothetical protein
MEVGRRYQYGRAWTRFKTVHETTVARIQPGRACAESSARETRPTARDSSNLLAHESIVGLAQSLTHSHGNLGIPQ